MPHRSLVRVRLAGASPYQVVLLLFTAVAGAGVLAGRDLPGSVAQLLPTWLGYGWAVGTLVGSLVAFYGLLMRSAYKGLLTEATGCLIHGGVCLVYVICLGRSHPGPGTAFVLLLISGVAVASLARSRQARKEASHLLATVVPALRALPDQDG